MNKKADVTEGIVAAVLYLPLTAIIVFALVSMPTALIEKGLQPTAFDQEIEARQILAQLWETNEYTGRTSPFEYTTDLSEITKTETKKKLAYRVTIDGKEAIYDESTYKDAKPIAPYIYSKHEEKLIVMVAGKPKELTIEVYYPYKYELKG